MLQMFYTKQNNFFLYEIITKIIFESIIIERYFFSNEVGINLSTLN